MWHADEEYRDALARLDFMHHDSKTLRVVKVAAGKCDGVPIIAGKNAGKTPSKKRFERP